MLCSLRTLPQKNGESIQSPAAFLGTGKQTKHKQAFLADVKNTLEYLQEMHHPKLASMNSPLSRLGVISLIWTAIGCWGVCQSLKKHLQTVSFSTHSGSKKY